MDTVGVAVPMGGTLIKARPRSLPWSVVDRWCLRHGYTPDEGDFLRACFGFLDEEYLAWWQRVEGSK